MPQCEVCGKEFKAVTNSHVRTHDMSMEEYRMLFPQARITGKQTREKLSRASSNRKHTIETKQKIARAQAGRKHGPMSEEQKRAISRKLKGRSLSETHKKNISESHKRIDHPWLRKPRKKRVIQICPFCGTEIMYLPHEARAYRGFCSLEHWYSYIREDPTRHPNWQGGISKEPYDFEFTPSLKAGIRQRDDFTCQLCGRFETENTIDGRALAIHHIDYDKSNCDPDNLIALCAICNSKVNYDREYWQSFFEDMKRHNEDLCI